MIIDISLVYKKYRVRADPQESANKRLSGVVLYIKIVMLRLA